jgi:hypothetical protein
MNTLYRPQTKYIDRGLIDKLEPCFNEIIAFCDANSKLTDREMLDGSMTIFKMQRLALVLQKIAKNEIGLKAGAEKAVYAYNTENILMLQSKQQTLQLDSMHPKQNNSPSGYSSMDLERLQEDEALKIIMNFATKYGESDMLRSLSNVTNQQQPLPYPLILPSKER